MHPLAEPRKQVPVTPIPLGLGAALAFSVAATLYLGILPNRVLQFAQQSAQELLPQQPAIVSGNAFEMRAPAPIPQH